VSPRHLSMLAITRFAFQDGVRAQPYKYGAPEQINLEAYLIARARGMATETPASP
jgi:hypothetical protein